MVIYQGKEENLREENARRETIEFHKKSRGTDERPSSSSFV